VSPDASWRKSSHSLPNSHCVETRPTAGGVQLRDSKDPDGPVLTFTPEGWEAFLAGVKAGRNPRSAKPGDSANEKRGSVHPGVARRAWLGDEAAHLPSLPL